MDYELFSADDHVDLEYLPWDLWQELVPAAYREAAPRVEETRDGKRWMAGGAPFGGAMGIIPKPEDPFRGRVGKNALRVEQIDGRWIPTVAELRLKTMGSDGVEGHVLYGPFSAFQLGDSKLNVLCMEAFNDWVATFCKANPSRLIGMGILPVHDAEAAVAEVYRCAKLGLKGVQFHAFAAYKFPWDEVWEPLWAAASEAGLAVSVHQSGGNWSCGRLPGATSLFGPPGRGVLATSVATAPSRLDEVLCSLILAGVLKRNPTLRVVLAECGIGWIPYVLDRTDRKYEERHSQKRDDAADLEMMPSDYYKRQMYATFQEDPIGIRLLDAMGPQTAMWASDYPHTESTWPESHRTVDALFQHVDSAVTRLVVRENAKKLYASGE